MVIAKKVCLIGDFAVGKTSLIRRYVEGQFNDKYLSTVGVKISRKDVEINHPESPTSSRFRLIIWDLEGRTQFEALTPSYLKGASGAIVVGALDRQVTLDSLEQHIQLFGTTNPGQSVVVALNKADRLPTERQRSLLKQYRPTISSTVIDYQLTSAKTGENVENLFDTLARSWLASPNRPAP